MKQKAGEANAERKGGGGGGKRKVLLAFLLRVQGLEKMDIAKFYMKVMLLAR